MLMAYSLLCVSPSILMAFQMFHSFLIWLFAKLILPRVESWRRKWQPTPVFLPGESQGWGNLVGCRLWGRTESDTTEAPQQQQQQSREQGQKGTQEDLGDPGSVVFLDLDGVRFENSPVLIILYVCHFCLVTQFVWLFATTWTVAHQATLFVGFPRQEYWSVLPFSSPGDLPDPGIEPSSSALAGEFFTTEPPGKPLCLYTVLLKNPTLFSSDLCLFYSHFESIIQVSC